MPDTQGGVLAIFPGPAQAAAAIKAVRALGAKDVRAQSPAPYPDVEEALGRPRSRLGWITFFGGVAGCLGAVALTVGTSLDLPIMVGGKPVVSWPAYTVIMFEGTVLVAGVTNFVAVVVGSFLARMKRPVPHDDRATVDRVSVWVAGSDASRFETALRSHGAEEVLT